MASGLYELPGREGAHGHAVKGNRTDELVEGRNSVGLHPWGVSLIGKPLLQKILDPH